MKRPGQTSSTESPVRKPASGDEPTGGSATPRFFGIGEGVRVSFDRSIDEGDAVTFTLGKEVYWPHRSAGYEVGPFSVTVRLRKGESPEDLAKRAHHFLDVLFEAEFELKRKQFRERLGESGEKV